MYPATPTFWVEESGECFVSLRRYTNSIVPQADEHNALADARWTRDACLAIDW